MLATLATLLAGASAAPATARHRHGAGTHAAAMVEPAAAEQMERVAARLEAIRHSVSKVLAEPQFRGNRGIVSQLDRISDKLERLASGSEAVSDPPPTPSPDGDEEREQVAALARRFASIRKSIDGDAKLRRNPVRRRTAPSLLRLPSRSLCLTTTVAYDQLSVA